MSKYATSSNQAPDPTVHERATPESGNAFEAGSAADAWASAPGIEPLPLLIAPGPNDPDGDIGEFEERLARLKKTRDLMAPSALARAREPLPPTAPLKPSDLRGDIEEFEKRLAGLKKASEFMAPFPLAAPLVAPSEPKTSQAQARESRADRVAVSQIVAKDRDEVVAFLARGFNYPLAFYSRLFDELARREAPDGFPRFGYALRKGDRIVGAILLIFTRMQERDVSFVRCHVTSWFVEPEFRPLAGVFFARGLKLKDVAYINVSAGAWTRPIIERQGFRQYSDGQFVVPTPVVALMRQRDADVRICDGALPPPVPCDPYEARLLADHAAFGCLTLWCVSGEEALPFVFHARRLRRIVPGVELAYCRDIESFLRFARPLARFLLAHGRLLVSVDAKRPLTGVPGLYMAGKYPRFCKGRQPRQGDLAYTQRVMCPFVSGHHGG